MRTIRQKHIHLAALFDTPPPPPGDTLGFLSRSGIFTFLAQIELGFQSVALRSGEEFPPPPPKHGGIQIDTEVTVIGPHPAVGQNGRVGTEGTDTTHQNLSVNFKKRSLGLYSLK